jgi:hypothetical protein
MLLLLLLLGFTLTILKDRPLQVEQTVIYLLHLGIYPAFEGAKRP